MKLPHLSPLRTITLVYISELRSRRVFLHALAASVFCGIVATGIAAAAAPVQTHTPYSDAFAIVTPLGIKEGRVSARGGLTYGLSHKDTVYSYRISTNGKDEVCSAAGATLLCALKPFGLTQGQSYTLSLKRYYNGRLAGEVMQQKIFAIEPLEVTAASIGNGSTIYTIPTEITITLNKDLLPVTDKQVKLNQVNGTMRTVLPATFKLENFKILHILLSAPLPRTANIELTMGDIEGADQSFLNAKYVLPFKTSGGPVVTNINLASFKIPSIASYTLTFDTALLATQPAVNFVSVVAGGKSVAATMTISGRTVHVTQAALPNCTPFTVKVASGLANEFGVTGSPAWQYSSRTICQSVGSIGTSVQGRALTYYRFGTGSSVIVYVANTHGNEKSSAATMSAWVDALEANPSKIPASRTIYVIPDLNPDGYAANTRTNAHGVDLNRNFPSNNWKSAVTMPDKSFNATGGGTAPLSEPESAALAAFVLAQRPRLVITYHASAGVVIPNDSGDSAVIAQTYDKNSNLYYKPNSQTQTIFDYDTTGAFEDWLHDKQNITAILVELWTMTNNEFNKNQNALWYTAAL